MVGLGTDEDDRYRTSPSQGLTGPSNNNELLLLQLLLLILPLLLILLLLLLFSYLTVLLQLYSYWNDYIVSLLLLLRTCNLPSTLL
jgi:hypothetical protein